jgi:hypothetical protein
LVELDPETGKRWEDRHGVAFDKTRRKVGNIEHFFNYDKLQKTGRLLRGLNVKVTDVSSFGSTVSLGNRVKYAKDHNEGTNNAREVTLKYPWTRGGATIKTGGSIHARPFMYPSKRVLRMPYVLIVRKMRTFGWTLGN